MSSYRLKELDLFIEIEKVILKFESASQVSQSLWDWRGGVLVYYFKRPSQNYRVFVTKCQISAQSSKEPWYYENYSIRHCSFTQEV